VYILKDPKLLETLTEHMCTHLIKESIYGPPRMWERV